MVYRRKGFAVINFLITLNVQQRWFLNGIEDGFRGVLEKVMVERAAKVIFFCHISNDRRRITNSHPHIKDGYNIHCRLLGSKDISINFENCIRLKNTGS